MRVVLYADDMEPITVIDLPEESCKFLAKNAHVRLAIQEQLIDIVGLGDHRSDTVKIVDIYAEVLERRGIRHMMLFTRDEEDALLLKSTFLPGQYAGLQERERQAFAQGFISALSRIGL